MAGGHLAPDLIRLSGAEPLFAKPGDSVPWTEFQVIQDAQPDMILVFDCNGCPNAMRHPVATRPGWSSLTAVTHHAVYRPNKNIANSNICYPEALAELIKLVTTWDQTQRKDMPDIWRRLDPHSTVLRVSAGTKWKYG